MNQQERQMLRAAVQIHAAIVRMNAQPLPPPNLANWSWEQCLRLVRQIEAAQQRGWNHAAVQLQQRLPDAIRQFQRGLESDLRDTMLNARTAAKPTLNDVFQSIRSLPEDFPSVRIDLRRRLLCVQTAPVTLEDIELGPFEVQLDWSRIGAPQPYKVLALEPYAAECNSSATHPHVQDGSLCEGDGRQAILQALAQGRLDDFFQVISSILHTYNAGSAFVRLEDWSGTPCADCGYSVSIEESTCCTRCGSTVCGECDRYCRHCNDVYCDSCTEACQGCSSSYCSACLELCSGCRESFCPECLIERCNDCHEDEQQHQQPEGSGECGSVPETAEPQAAAQTSAEAQTAAEAGTAIQPDRLGQALVSA